MSNADTKLQHILDTAIYCMSTAGMDYTKADVLGRSRKEGLVWIRTLAVSLSYSHGFTTSAIARYYKRTEADIRHLLGRDTTFRRTSGFYKMAAEEAKAILEREK